MKKYLFFISAVMALHSTPLYAKNIVETYIARLGPADHFNSSGSRLTTVASIIRQDRANYHLFGKYDREDQNDVFFNSTQNRSFLESIVRNSRINRHVSQQIINGNPVVRITLWNEGGGLYLVDIDLIDY